MPYDFSRPISPDKLQSLAESHLPTPLTTITTLPGPLYRTHLLHTPTHHLYILRTPPPRNLRLLRGELKLLETEASTLPSLPPPLPPLISHQIISTDLGTAYTLSGPYPGSPISTPTSPLTPAQQRSLGKYLAHLACTSARGRCKNWGKTYITLLEGLLRDAEDARVSVPYDGIRRVVRRGRGALEGVGEGRLFVLHDAHEAWNVLVEGEGGGEVVGLMDYSSALFGDPWMGSCFYHYRGSREFLEGFGGVVGGEAEVRWRLYTIYHALLVIVKQHYRPSVGKGGKDVELEARRVLTDVLKTLDERHE